MGALFGFLMLATALITFFTVKEPGVPQEESLLGFFETYKRVFQNKPYAIVPDAVEYDYLLTGRRTQGAFYGIWTFGIKIGQALALGITGIVLSCTGYLPDVIQTDSALLGIRLLFGPIPAFFFILAMITLYFYPINEKRYHEILTQIKRMEDTQVSTGCSKK